MSALVLQVFVSLMLVSLAVVAYVYAVRQRDHEHADRLSLFPLEEDDPPRRTQAELEKKEGPPP